ncbi:unnamed protein product [Effrenium voratum]|nr:unnamed protein product [Effrenium voratum]
MPSSHSLRTLRLLRAKKFWSSRASGAELEDIQILREQPFNIVSQESKLEKLAPGKDPARLGGHAGILGQKERTKEGRGGFPGTAVDYDILSNMPFQEHHWARREAGGLDVGRSKQGLDG